MTSPKIIAATLFALAVACSNTPPPESPQASAAPEAPDAGSAARPDAAKVEAHLREHVSYPATREQVLAACAQTTEFSQSEKAWISEQLPEGNYDSAERVIAALKL